MNHVFMVFFKRLSPNNLHVVTGFAAIETTESYYLDINHCFPDDQHLCKCVNSALFAL